MTDQAASDTGGFVDGNSFADARLAAFQRGDVKTVIGMYRDDAVVITPEGSIKGAAISAMMVALFEEFAQPGAR
jgi:hypothetical protein